MSVHTRREGKITNAYRHNWTWMAAAILGQGVRDVGTSEGRDLENFARGPTCALLCDLLDVAPDVYAEALRARAAWLRTDR